MNKLLTLAALVCLILPVTTYAAETDAPKDDGFVTLFNGKDWDGWRLQIKSGDDALAHQVFTIEDGMVHVFKDVPPGSEVGVKKIQTHGLMYTLKPYSRYIFRFEYKWGKNQTNNFDKFGYDAGCYFHVQNDKIWPNGVEYQVRYDQKIKKNHTGDIIGAAARGVDWTSADGKTFALPADGGKPMKLPKSIENVKADVVVHALDDQWNQCEFVAMGKEYCIYKVNGKIVNMATNLPVGDGIIGLQSETAEIYYRNIQIKELPEDIPAEKFLTATE